VDQPCQDAERGKLFQCLLRWPFGCLMGGGVADGPGQPRLSWSRSAGCGRCRGCIRAGQRSRRRASWTPRSSGPTTPLAIRPAAITEVRRSRGRGRHLAVDAEGWLLALVVTAVSISDKAGAGMLLIKLFDLFGTLKIMWADSGYAGAAGPLCQRRAAAVEVVKCTSPHSLQVVRPDG
jgi:hypothetical protein